MKHIIILILTIFYSNKISAQTNEENLYQLLQNSHSELRLYKDVEKSLQKLDLYFISMEMDKWSLNQIPKEHLELVKVITSKLILSNVRPTSLINTNLFNIYHELIKKYNDPYDIHILSCLYYFNNDCENARIWSDKAISMNSKDAFYFKGLALYLEEGSSCYQQNITKSINNIMYSARLGSIAAMDFLSRHYFEEKDVDKMIEYSFKACQDTMSSLPSFSANVLADSYLIGKNGLPKNLEKSKYYYEQLDKNMKFEAIIGLSKINLLEGRFKDAENILEDQFSLEEYNYILEDSNYIKSVKRVYLFILGNTKLRLNKNEGLTILKEFSDQKDGAASALIGAFYLLQGEPEKAYYYLKKADDEGDESASAALGRLFLNGNTREQQKTGFNYILKSANKGNIESQVLLGRLYKDGIGTKKDKKKSKYYYQLACTNGYQDACSELE